MSQWQRKSRRREGARCPKSLPSPSLRRRRQQGQSGRASRHVARDSFTRMSSGRALTSAGPYFTILPSDLMPVFNLPPDAPKRGKIPVDVDPAMPTTIIPELRSIEFTEFAYLCVIAAIQAADKVQIEKLNPKGGANLRYRIEIAAAFLCHVMEHA